MISRVERGLFAVVAVGLAGCGGGNALCDKTVDLVAKSGTCMGVYTAPLLGDKATCSTRTSMCSSDDKQVLTNALTCLDQLPVCSASGQLSWETQQKSCYEPLTGLSQGCKTAVFGEVLPGQDGGADAGPPPDAGRQPIDDGGNGLSFVAVANETGFAFAWVPLQPAGISTWELNAFDTDGGDADGGVRLPDFLIPGSTVRTHAQPGVGPNVSRRFYLAGLAADNTLAFGIVEVPDAGQVVSDGGMACAVHANCPPEKVCDLGFCKTQTCQTNVTCPQPDYSCNANITPHECVRQGGMQMYIDAGTLQGLNGSLAMLSQSWSVKTGAPTFHSQTVGGFVARRPDMVAVDSARQFIVMEQGGQPVGHFTNSRGREFVSDQQSAAIIDTVGSDVHVAFNAESQTLFACYSVGRGVRVRRSRDFGKTWGNTALTLEPEDDGGTDSTISSCDVAAWKSGSVLVATIDDDALVVRQVNPSLVVNGTPDIAFLSGPADGGGINVFTPRRPSIATLPSSDLVHIGFTASRINGGAGATDSDIFGVYRDTTTGGLFTQVSFIDAPGGGMGNGLPQDYVSVAIDPVTKRGLAVWTTLENSAIGGYSTVYLGFTGANKKWVTGADLSVFMQIGGTGSYPLFPQRQPTDQYDAWGGQVAVTPDGRVYVMVLAGRREQQVNEIYPWSVEFAFDAGSPVGGQGWFKPPMVQMSTTKALDARAGGNSLPSTSTAFAADSQISIYGTFVEGIGNLNAEENRAVFVTKP